jgi:hypothetical protein
MKRWEARPVEARRGFARGLLLALLAATAVGGAAPASAEVTIKAMLIYASNDPAPLDDRLQRVEYQLRRMFPFEHYRHFGQDSRTLSLPGEVTLDLGRGHRIVAELSKGDDGEVHAWVRWMSGDTTVLNSGFSMKKGAPTFLGGPTHENGKLLVTLEIAPATPAPPP